MAEPIRKLSVAKQLEAVSLGELIHQAMRAAIERAVHEELDAALGAGVYERGEGRRGYRNGHRKWTLSGPTGPAALTVPRATLFTESGKREWSSQLLPRYQRRMPELNEAIIATYLCGANTRRIRGALKPLLNAAPLSKSSVSRVVSTMQGELAAWRTRSLSELKPIYLYLDAFALRVRSGGKVVSVPVLGAVAVLADGSKQLLSLEMCGSESHEAWKGFLDDLVARGLKAPTLCIVDGNPGLRRAVELVWPIADVQRCAVHSDAAYTTQKALDELDTARKNRNAVAGVFVMARSHAGDAFPRFARYGNNVLVTWDDQDPSSDAYLHAAVLLGIALVTRAKTVGDAGDIAALCDVESRIEAELTRLEKMEKCNESIRKNSDGIGDEIRKAEKALDLLLRKAKSTLRALNIELHDEAAERSTPIALPNGSLDQAVAALGAGGEAA